MKGKGSMGCGSDRAASEVGALGQHGTRKIQQARGTAQQQLLALQGRLEQQDAQEHDKGKQIIHSL